MSPLARGEGADNTPVGTRKVKAIIGIIYLLTFMVIRNSAGVFYDLRLQKTTLSNRGVFKALLYPIWVTNKKNDSKVRLTTEMIALQSTDRL